MTILRTKNAPPSRDQLIAYITKELTKSGAVLHTMKGCTHCEDQKGRFGDFVSNIEIEIHDYRTQSAIRSFPNVDAKI